MSSCRILPPTLDSYQIVLDSDPDSNSDLKGCYRSFSLDFPRIQTLTNIEKPYEYAQEALEESLLFAEEDIDSNNPIDDVENITLQIFADLHSIADRVKRTEIQAALRPLSIENLDGDGTDEDFVINYTTSFPSSSYRPFRKDTNFYQDHLNYNVQTKNVIYNILSTLGNILLGYESRYPNQDKRTNEQTLSALRSHKDDTWFGGLCNNYTSTFNLKMSSAFDQAEELINKRKSFAKQAYLQRITFYTMLAMTLIGKILKQKVTTSVGLVALSVTTVFMLFHYGKSSLQLSRLCYTLKSRVNEAEKEARRHRIK